MPIGSWSSCRSCSCRRCPAGTTVAAYTNVTADHLDRHGTLEAYRRGQAPARRARRSRRRARPQRRRPGRRRATRGHRRRASCAYRRGELPPGRPRRRPRLDRRRCDRAVAAAGGGTGAGRSPGGRIMPVAELGIPGAHNVSNALAAVARRAALRHRARRDPARGRGAFGGVEHRLERVAEIDGVRFVNDSQGTQPDAVIAALRAFDGADRADRRRPRQGRRPDGARDGRRGARAAAAVLIGESGPDAGAAVPRRRARTTRAGGDARGGRRGGGRARPRGLPRRPDGADRYGPAEPGRRELRHVRGLRGPRPGVQGGRGAARARASGGS